MQDAVEYLTNRIREDEDRLEHNPDHRISNGVRLFLEIRNDYTDLYDLNERAFELIRMRSPVLLTAISGMIGRMVLAEHHLDIQPTKDATFDVRLDVASIHISLGDLLIEALLNTDYLTISQQFPYVVKVTPAYELEPVELLRHTTTTPIPLTTRMMRDNKRPLIKRK